MEKNSPQLENQNSAAVSGADNTIQKKAFFDWLKLNRDFTKGKLP